MKCCRLFATKDRIPDAKTTSLDPNVSMKRRVFAAIKDAFWWHSHPCLRKNNSGVSECMRAIHSATMYTDHMMNQSIAIIGNLKECDPLFIPLVHAILKHDAFKLKKRSQYDISVSMLSTSLDRLLQDYCSSASSTHNL